MKCVNWNGLTNAEREAVLTRPEPIATAELRQRCADIIEQVKVDGDAACIAFTKQFDGVDVTALQVRESDIVAASIPAEEQAAIELAIDTITTAHQAQQVQATSVSTRKGVSITRKAVPIEHVGLYIPGGSAPLISSLLMQAIPAKLAGCKTIVICTPPPVSPAILVAARLCGVKTIFALGGAQAIAAMAYGTKIIPKVDKIFGPGNAWVCMAKQLVWQDVSIDMPAGPSEVCVIADESARADFVAADLLSQAEHGPDSQSILFTPSGRFADTVASEVRRLSATLTRQSILDKSLQAMRLIVVEGLEQAMTLSNTYAPEHLIINIQNAAQLAEQVTAAGSVFVGPYSAEVLGDYTSGSNHVLPTGGWARAVSGLSLSAFTTTISFQTIDQTGLKAIGPAAVTLANMEALDAHALAASIRLEAVS
jgi:histidinol dehydrogenase